METYNSTDFIKLQESQWGEGIELNKIVLFKENTITNSVLWHVGKVDSVLTSTNGDEVIMIRKCNPHGDTIDDKYHFFTLKEKDKVLALDETLMELVIKKTYPPFYLTAEEIINARVEKAIKESSSATTLSREELEMLSKDEIGHADVVYAINRLKDVIETRLGYIEKKLEEISSKMWGFGDTWTYPNPATPEPIKPWYKEDWNHITCGDDKGCSVYKINGDASNIKDFICHCENNPCTTTTMKNDDNIKYTHTYTTNITDKKRKKK